MAIQPSQQFAHLSLRQSVGVLLLNHDLTQIMIFERVTTQGYWQLPQGGLDNEEVIPAAMRELHEETGLHSVEILQIPDETTIYYYPDEVIAATTGRESHLGQEHRWVFMRFNGEESEIKFDTTGHPEFQAYKWVDLDQFLIVTAAQKRDIYTSVLRMLRQYLTDSAVTKPDRTPRLGS